MSSLDNLSNTPVQPGDEVRNRKTNADYVVQSVATLASGAGFIYYLLRTVDGRLEEYRAQNLDDLDLYITRTNIDELTPEGVIAKKQDVLNRVFKGNQQVINNVNSDENSLYRDVISLLDDADSETIPKKLNDLTDSLLMHSEGRYTPIEIEKMLRDALGANSEFYSDEHITSIAEKLHQVATSGQKMSTLQPFNKASKLNSNFFGGAEDRGFTRYLKDEVFKTKHAGRYFPDEDIYSRNTALNAILKEEKPSLRTFKLVQAATQQKPSRRFIAALRSSDPNVANDAIKRLMSDDKSGLIQDFYLKYNQVNGRKGNKFEYGKRMFNRKSAAATRLRGKFSSRVNFDSYLKNSSPTTPEGLSKYLAINTETVVHDLFEGKTLQYGKQVMYSGDMALYKLLEAKTGDTKSVLLSHQRLQQIREQHVVDLDELLSEQARIKENLSSTMKATINAEMGVSTVETYRRNPLVEFGLTEANPMAATESGNLFYGRSGVKSVYMTLDQLQEEIKGGNTFTNLKSVKVSEDLYSNLSSASQADMQKAFNTAGTIYEAGSGLSFGEDLPNQQQLTANAVELKAAYMRTRDEARMGFAIIEDATGNKALRLVGSEQNVNLSAQLDRGFQSLTEHGPGSIRLDIETAIDPVTRSSRIGQIGVGYKNDLGEVVSLQDFRARTGSVFEEIKAIHTAAQHVNASSLMGTQGSHDMNTIMERISALREKVKPGAQMEALLDQSYTIFKEASNTKMYDVISLLHSAGTVPGATGSVSFGVGNASQPRAAKMLLGEDTTHNAMEDVAQSFKITDRLGLGSSKFFGVLDPKSLKDTGAMFYASGTRTGNLRGNIMKLIGFDNSGLGNGVTARFRPMAVGADGSLRPVGSEMGVSASSANILGGMFKEMELLKDASPEAIAELQKRSRAVSDDIGGRYLRGLNPLSKSFLDQTGTFDASVSGVYGHHELAVVSEVQKLMQNHQEEIGRLRFDLGGLTEDTKESKISEFLDRVTADIPTRKIGHDTFVERAKYHLEQTLLNPVHADVIGKDGVLGKMIDSDLGQRLIKLTNQGLRGEVSAFEEASVLSARAFGMLASDPGQLGTFVSNPRLGLSITGHQRGYKLAASTPLSVEMSGGAIESSVKSYASQLFLDVAKKGERSVANDLFNNVRLTGSAVDKGLEYIEQLRGANDPSIFDTTLQQMHHLDHNSEFGEVTKTLDSLMSSPEFRTHIRTNIIQRGDAFKNHYKHIDASLDSTHITDSIQRRLDASFAEHERADKALSSFMYKSMNEDAHGTMAYFTDVIENYIDPKRLLNVDQGIMKNLIDKTATDMEAARLAPGGSQVSKVLEASAEILAEARQQGMSYADSMSHARNFLDDSIGSIKGSAGNEVIGNLNERALQYQGMISAGQGPRRSAMDLEIATMSARVDTSASDFLRTQQEVVTKAMATAARNPKLMLPMAAVGGALALIGAAKTPQERYSGGYLSTATPGIIGAMSEIPGAASPPHVFHGETIPFMLKVDIRGQVDNQVQLKAFQKALSETVHSNTNVEKVDTRDKINNPAQKAKDKFEDTNVYRSLLDSL